MRITISKLNQIIQEETERLFIEQAGIVSTSHTEKVTPRTGGGEDWTSTEEAESQQSGTDAQTSKAMEDAAEVSGETSLRSDSSGASTLQSTSRVATPGAASKLTRAKTGGGVTSAPKQFQRTVSTGGTGRQTQEKTTSGYRQGADASLRGGHRGFAAGGKKQGDVYDTARKQQGIPMPSQQAEGKETLTVQRIIQEEVEKLLAEELGRFEGLEGGPLSGYINDYNQTRRMTPEELDQHVGMGVRWEDDKLIQTNPMSYEVPPLTPIDQPIQPGMGQGTDIEDPRAIRLRMADPLNLRHARHGIGRFLTPHHRPEAADDIALDLLRAKEASKADMTNADKRELVKFLVDMGQLTSSPYMAAIEMAGEEQFLNWLKNNPDKLRGWLDSRNK